MEDLIREVNRLRSEEVSKLIAIRMREFERLGKSSAEEIFKELAFCLLTANYSAEGGIRIQRAIGDGFITLPREELERRLRELGHRFPKARAEYIVEARKLLPELKGILSSFKDERSLREWLVKNVRGLGYKEASHFLRNIGYKNVAIIDYHIVDVLVRYGIIERPKTLTRRKYLEIESILGKIAEKTGLTLGELDLYLWYMETGKVLK
ncbi:MAG: N-glycosylase/DNA lyase [Candidatus Korarchaeota archaeon]|nr:N-glycosylase/DNA lyase [Candidatus Korarchaeota archaeon]